MKSRFLVVTVSIVVGLLAAMIATGYVSSVRAKVLTDAEPREIYVTTKNVPAGTSLDEMLTGGMAERTKVPSRYAAEDAVSDAGQVSARVLLYDVGPGEQLTSSKFKASGGSDIVGQVPRGKLAVSVPIDEVTGVGASLRPGDSIVLFATFSPGPNGVDMTRILLPAAQVIASSFDSGSQQRGGALGARQNGSTKQTITLAVSPNEAEKVVFAAEKGHVWMALRPLSKDLSAKTGGQTMRSVFR